MDELELIVEPGLRIGPIKLGMSREMVDEIIRNQSELAELEKQLGLRVRFDDDDVCEEIQIVITDGPPAVLIEGKCVNGISKREVDEHIQQLYGMEYCGLSFCKWELSDDFYTFLGIEKPERNRN